MRVFVSKEKRWKVRPDQGEWSELKEGSIF